MNSQNTQPGRSTLERAAGFFLFPLLDFLYPPHCLLCYNSAPSKTPLLCNDCLHILPHTAVPLIPAQQCSSGIKYSFQYSFAPFEYDEHLQKLIHNFKYRNMHSLSKPLGRMVGEILNKNSHCKNIDVLVPVPLHPTRYRERGYNQSLCLSREIGRHTDLPIISPLKRIRYTKKQATYNREQRLTNLKNAFALKRSFASVIEYKHVGLVDDVLTTGSTMNECAKILKKAGVKSITAISLVRA